MGFRLEDDLGFLLARTHRAMRRWIMSKLEPMGITYEQFRVLNALCEQDNISQMALSDRTNVDKTSVARMLERMEAAGLLSRSEDPLDSRVNLVTLTDQGRQLQEEIIPQRNLVLGQAVEGLREKEVKELKRLLNRVYERCKED